MTRLNYVEFSGQQYGTVPASVLGNAKVFTIEAVISTTSTKYTGTYYCWGTIVGIEIANTWKDDFSFCVNDGCLCFWSQSQRNTAPKNYKVTSGARVNDGKRHKVAVVSNADGSIDLYCDGKNVAHTESVEATIANTALYLNYNTNKNSYLSMRLYEMRFWNRALSSQELFADITGRESGLQAWYIPTNSSSIKDSSGHGRTVSLSGNPYAIDGTVRLKLDTRRDIVNLSKGWLVGTLGKAEEISKSVEPQFTGKGTTYTAPEDNERIKRYFNYTNLPETKSKTGYAFDHFEESSSQYVDFFMLNIPATKEVWIKFDVYFGSGGGGAYDRIVVGDARTGRKGTYVSGNENSLVGDNPIISFTSYDSCASFHVILSGKNSELGDVSVDEKIADVYFPDIKYNQLATCLVHFRSGRTDGIIEAWWNGIRVQHGNIPEGTVTLDNGLRRYTHTSGSTVYSYYLDYLFKGNVNRGEDFTDLYLQAWGLVSNVLVSNMRIGFNANTIEVNSSLDVSIEIELGIELNLLIDIKRKITKDVLISLNVKRSIIALYLDVNRNILAELIFSPIDTKEIFQNKATRLQSSKRLLGDTPDLPEQEPLVATSLDVNEIEQNVTSERNTSGTQSVEINIAEQQLTDQVTFTSIIQYAIMQYISGQYFDYNYKFRIESKSRQGILHTYHCCSNIDQLLYTQIFLKEVITEVVEKDNEDGTTTVTINGEQAEGETQEADSSTYVGRERQIVISSDDNTKKEELRLLETGEYHPLDEWAGVIAEALGLSPVVQLEDTGNYSGLFSSLNGKALHGRTYIDIIREVYGWTARIPHLMINVYIRDDKLFVVQRGSEENVIDISQTKHTIPIIQEELVRMAWGSTPYSLTKIETKTIGIKSLGGDSDENPDDPTHSGGSEEGDNKDNVWSGVGTVTTTNSAGTSVTKYDYSGNGVLRGTTTTFTSNNDSSQNSTTVVKNSYGSDGLLESVTTTVTHSSAPENDTQTIVNYGYLTLADGKKFLANEVTAEYERNSEGFFELVDTRTTAKSPTGRGQGTSYDSKGKGTASGNVGDDRVTPYQLRSAFNTTKALSQQIFEEKKTTTLSGFYDIDPSFPLLLERDRIFVTNELKYLNRSIKVTASLSVYDFAHIIDFNDRIILDGEEYFLVNNTARTTPRIYNEQNLTLVRWYRQIGEGI